MPIHEKHLIREESLLTHDKLVIDGIDVSGHWSTFIESRVVTDYNEKLEDEIAALPGGEHIHRCWQCGSCTNSCTVNAVNPDFNPRYWIYLARVGMESELLRDKDIIWQCVSCNKCTYACPRDVFPEGVMKAMSHWLTLKGHAPRSPSLIFDEEFSKQVFESGRIEEISLIRRFFARTGQPPIQDWLVAMAARIAKHLPVKMGLTMLRHMLFPPRTKGWDRAREAIDEYVHEQEAKHREALGLKANGAGIADAQVANPAQDRKLLLDTLKSELRR